MTDEPRELDYVDQAELLRLRDELRAANDEISALTAERDELREQLAYFSTTGGQR